MKQHLLDLVAGLPRNEFTAAVAGPGDTSGMAREIETMDVKYHPVNITGPLNPVKDLKCIYELYKLIRKEGFDIVHCHGSKAGLVGRMAARMAGTPVIIVTAHNFVVYDEVPPVKRLIFTWGEKFLSRKTSGIITVSRALKAELKEKFSIPDNKIAAIYNGIDLDRFKTASGADKLREAYGIGKDVPVVGTVARMAPQKGLSFFVDAISVLAKESCGAVFLIVGDGPLRIELEARAHRLGVAGKIIFTGYQPDITPFLKLFDIFVVPSIAEGLSITTIEAMAAGKPVIASRVGGLPELVKPEHNGLLTPPRDAAALAGAIRFLLERPELREKMGLAGKNMAMAEFSKGQMIAKTADFYRLCLGKSAGNLGGETC